MDPKGSKRPVEEEGTAQSSTELPPVGTRRTSVRNLSCWHGKPDQKSCRNYLNSGLPRRVLHYKRGEWTDFPESAREAIIDGFRLQMPCMAVFFGCQLMVVDLLCMVMSNSMTNKHASVAWIDEADRCFFPWLSFDGGADEPSEQISGPVRPQAYSVPAPQMVTANILNLQRDSVSFALMEKLFLLGMPSFVEPENVVCICECVPEDTNGQVQYQAFESQLRSMREKRGNANAKHLWFGSTTQEILRILTYGFGSAVAPTAGAAFGSGIYLTPQHRPFSSVNLCSVDGNGVQCMLLCQVILGNMEQVRPGSLQNSPSSDEYDSGVDDHAAPTCFVVWASHANTRIHPRCVFIFRLPPDLQEYFFDLSDVRFDKNPIRKVPDFKRLSDPKQTLVSLAGHAINQQMPYTSLLAEVRHHISPIEKELLFRHHLDFQKGALTVEKLLEKITLVLGDNLLVSTFKRARDHVSRLSLHFCCIHVILEDSLLY
ncbi:Poly(ADP-ribose) polymerase catalytic domain [Musa troglodytarum]|uniref:Poly(ADP-ribose) polymerase catalytic domain n=1 Tax=Musa troglodytarum TaxID=320322 RepID=A0A9E7HGQ9_9LILI|nr:Poly(ADP-ribose) polymerase catalytic domain [Musa troglodytarum]